MRLHSIKKRLPSHQQVTGNKYLRFLGDHISDPNLWHFRRHSVAKAAAIGVFCAFLPMPFEMIPAAIGAILWRANLPIAIAGVWLSNPVTWLPLWGPSYLLGAWLLNQPAMDLDELTIEILTKHIGALWVGCVLTGIVIAAIVYFCVHGLWRARVSNSWRNRRHGKNS